MVAPGIFSNLDMWTMQVQGDDTLPYMLARSVFMLMRYGEAGKDGREVYLDNRTDRLLAIPSGVSVSNVLFELTSARRSTLPYLPTPVHKLSRSTSALE